MEISLVIKMEQVKFETSMKNIPLGGKKEYAMQLTHSIRKVVYAMSWAAFIFLNNIQCEEKETYVVIMSPDNCNNLHAYFSNPQ